jgi:hypothetical protein
MPQNPQISIIIRQVGILACKQEWILHTIYGDISFPKLACEDVSFIICFRDMRQHGIPRE